MSDNERLCQCLSGKINPEARFGRIFSLGLYIFLNLFFGLEPLRISMQKSLVVNPN